MSNKHDPDPSGRQFCLCANIRKTARKITAAYDAALKSAGLNATQFTVLTAIELMENQRQSDIADALGMDATTLTRNLKPLVTKGWIEIKHGKDRRVRLLSLSKKGKAIVKQAIPLWKQIQDRFVESLGKGQWQKLNDELGAVQEIQ